MASKYNNTGFLLNQIQKLTTWPSGPAGEAEQVTRLGRVSPIAWQHINFHGRFEFLDPPAPIDLESVVQDLVRGEFGISEVLN